MFVLFLDKKDNIYNSYTRQNATLYIFKIDSLGRTRSREPSTSSIDKSSSADLAVAKKKLTGIVVVFILLVAC